MKKLQYISRRFLLMLSLGVVLFATSCDDNPASNNGEDHEHTEPFGLELVYDNEVIIEYFNGTVTEHQHMHLHAGEEYFFEIRFLAEDGDHIHAEDIDDDYYLDWEIENESVLNIHQHEDDSPWSFYIDALAEGESHVQFLLMHGTPGDGHSDFETPAITSDNAIEFHIEAEDHED